jgi:hypothetical protein
MKTGEGRAGQDRTAQGRTGLCPHLTCTYHLCYVRYTGRIQIA